LGGGLRKMNKRNRRKIDRWEGGIEMKNRRREKDRRIEEERLGRRKGIGEEREENRRREEYSINKYSIRYNMYNNI